MTAFAPRIWNARIGAGHRRVPGPDARPVSVPHPSFGPIDRNNPSHRSRKGCVR